MCLSGMLSKDEFSKYICVTVLSNTGVFLALTLKVFDRIYFINFLSQFINNLFTSHLLDSRQYWNSMLFVEVYKSPDSVSLTF